MLCQETLHEVLLCSLMLSITSHVTGFDISSELLESGQSMQVVM
jgi:hypothetical protein